MTLSAGDGSIPLLIALTMGTSCNVFLLHALTLPPLIETDVNCEISHHKLVNDQKCNVLLERCDALVEKYEVVTANCVQTVCGKNVSVRFANFTNEQKAIPAGTNVARLIPIAGSGNINYINMYSIIAETNSVKQAQPIADELIRQVKIDSTDLDIVEKEALIQLISKHSSASSIDGEVLGRTSLVKHSFDTGETPPIRQHPRRMSDEQKRKVDKLIGCSNSAWSSPIVLVRKKRWRVKILILC